MPNPNAPKLVGAALAAAVTLIAGFEGLVTHAYRDPGGVKTICYGHTEGVQMGQRKTKEECYDLLASDLPKYEAYVDRCVHVPISTKRRIALTSFAFNVGPGGICHSAVVRLLNQGDVQGGCNALMYYTHQRGIHYPLPGLVRRRKAERALCLQED